MFEELPDIFNVVYLFIYLFIYFWLCWVFVSLRGLSLVAASGGHSSSRCTGLLLSRPLLLRSTGSRRAGSVVVAHRPSCSAACGIFPDQGSNPCPLNWQADSQPLRHQGSPQCSFNLHFTYVWSRTFFLIFKGYLYSFVSNCLFMSFAHFPIGFYIFFLSIFKMALYIGKKLAFYLWYILQTFSPISHCLLTSLIAFFHADFYKYFYVIKFINHFSYYLWILIQFRNPFSVPRNLPMFSFSTCRIPFFLQLSDPFQNIFLCVVGGIGLTLLSLTGYPRVLAPLIKKIICAQVIFDVTFIFRLY